MNKNIKNIIFDLGGVVIDLSRDSSVEHLQKIGLTDADRLLDPYVQRGPFLQLETGKITAAQFFDLVRDEISNAGRPVPTDDEIARAFEKFLIGIPVERLQRIRDLRRAGYRVYALSNTNPVMFNGWISEAFQAEGLRFYDYFDGAVTSFQEGYCKPDPRLFEVVLRRYGLDPAETLMLDDAPKNAQAAADAGMQAVRVGYTPADDMMAITAPLLEN